MADEKKRTKLTPLSVTRNDVSLDFQDTEVMKGKEKGWPYLAPKVTAENLDTVIAWMDRGTAAAKLNAFLKSLSQGWMEEAEEQSKNGEGVIDNDKLREVFNTLAVDFSARGEPIPALKGQIEELTNCITALDPTEDGFAESFKDYAEQIKKLQIAISAKKRKTKEDEAAAANVT